MISLIQTAEGALNETHAILQRMRELSVQSSNDTNTDSDRAELQKEVDQLSAALTDISENTEFNTQKLLNGSFEGTFHIGANEGQNLSVEIDSMNASSLGVVGHTGADVVLTGVSGIDVSNNTDTAFDVSYNASQTGSGDAAIEETTATVDASGNVNITLAQAAGTGSGAGAITATTEDVYNALQSIGKLTVSQGTGYDGTATATVGGNNTITAGTVDPAKGIDISSQTSADAAITTIQSAIDNVSAERSKLGAVQNRLDHTINNLGTSAENLTAAESRIRDVDYDLAA